MKHCVPILLYYTMLAFNCYIWDLDTPTFWVGNFSYTAFYIVALNSLYYAQ